MPYQSSTVGAGVLSHFLVIDFFFLLAAKRACSSFVSLLCFRTTTWPKYSVSIFMDMAVLNTAHSVLWIPSRYELILGHSQNMWECFASADPRCLRHVGLLMCFSWCGVLKYLTMFFQQCPLPLHGISWGPLKATYSPPGLLWNHYSSFFSPPISLCTSG